MICDRDPFTLPGPDQKPYPHGNPLQVCWNMVTMKCLVFPAAFLILLLVVPAIGTGPSPVFCPEATEGVDVSLRNITCGAGSPVVYREPEPQVTLLLLESNQTTFPGPRDMAFGPRRIEVSAGAPALLLGAAVACSAVFGIILCRKRKAARDCQEK